MDLPSTWAADRTFTTLSLHVGLCGRHLIDVTGRAEAMLEAREELVEPTELVDLMEGGAA